MVLSCRLYRCDVGMEVLPVALVKGGRLVVDAGDFVLVIGPDPRVVGEFELVLRPVDSVVSAELVVRPCPSKQG